MEYTRIGAMMRIRERRCGLVAIILALTFIAACSPDNPLEKFEKQAKDMPGRFKVSGKGYLLDREQPGLIHDDAMVYTADAGARTFDFKKKTVLRNLFVGRLEDFASLPPDERRETEDIARGAVKFIRELETKQHPLSDVDQRHREVLTEFLARAAQTH